MLGTMLNVEWKGNYMARNEKNRKALVKPKQNSSNEGGFFQRKDFFKKWPSYEDIFKCERIPVKDLQQLKQFINDSKNIALIKEIAKANTTLEESVGVAATVLWGVASSGQMIIEHSRGDFISINERARAIAKITSFSNWLASRVLPTMGYPIKKFSMPDGTIRSASPKAYNNRAVEGFRDIPERLVALADNFKTLGISKDKWDDFLWPATDIRQRSRGRPQKETLIIMVETLARLFLERSGKPHWRLVRDIYNGITGETRETEDIKMSVTRNNNKFLKTVTCLKTHKTKTFKITSS
jgi:hypothetical protein